jgi:PAS domain-containing protein
VTNPHPLPSGPTVGRYGLALASVAAAFGLAHAFLYFDLPLPFAALALCAIAVTFWYGGNKPGVLAALLSAVARTFFFEPDVPLVSRLAYDFVFLIFAVLMAQATRARDELETRVAERTAALTHANEKLRQSEAYLAEAQRLTHTGSWAGNVVTGESLHSSEEHTRLYGLDPDQGEPSFDDIYRRVHPDDQARLVKVFRDASRARTDVTVDYRIVLPDGATRHVLAVGHPVGTPSAHPGEFVGFLMDVTERRQADEERERLRQVQADLTHISRVTTMGELTASLGHEVNQPIAAAVTDAKTCLRWLDRATPDVDEARAAAARVVTDVTRAAEIVSRIRQLFRKGIPKREEVDVRAGAGRAARGGRSRAIAAGHDEPHPERHRLDEGDLRRPRARRQVAADGRRGGRRGERYRSWSTGQTRRRDLQRVLHDQGTGHRHGPLHQPLDRRIAWRQALGRGPPPARRKLPRQSSPDSGDE